MASDGGAGVALDADEGWGGGTRVRAFSDYVAPQPQLQMLTTSTTTITAPAPAPPALDREPSSYGAGGKSRASRKSGNRSVPYGRPAVGRHAAAGPQASAAILASASAQALAEKAQGGGAWLGSGISKMFSTVEVRHLDADEQISSPSIDADNIQAGNGQMGNAENCDRHEVEVANSSLSDVETLLKQKTLSRDEFQRLSVLLQSRVVSNGVEKKQQPKHVEFDVRSSRQEVHPSGGTQSEAQRWRQDLQRSREERENGVRTLSTYENGGPSTATPAGASESLDALSSSPVEVAIAFMGGRPSRQDGTPVVEPLTRRDENRLSSGPPPSPHLSQTTLAKWTAPDLLCEDQFRTPPPPNAHSWGRNRTISRTPYSRPLRLLPSRERVIDGTYGTPSATRWTPIRTPVTGGREMLKRRSTVLDEGWTSGGPIRRTRQKAIVPVAPSNLSQSRGPAFSMTPKPGSSLMSLPSPVGGKLAVGTLSPKNVGATPTKEKDVLTLSGNSYVPAQSSETARKILETLEKMTPSPRGKALVDELALVRDRPPAALTEDMLNDQARKSMTFVEYSVPSDSQEPGPSGRSRENESPSLGYPGSTLKTSDTRTRIKGKGKASLSPIENGPVGQGGLLTASERTTTADGPVKLVAVRTKDTDTGLASEIDKGKGFRMNAVFEESGSDDEGRLSSPSLPISTSKLPSTTSKSSTVTAPAFGTAPLSPTITTAAGLSSFSASVSAFDISKAGSSGFTFPTRASLEGPPTPKAMSPASTSPKATPLAFFPFAQAAPVAASGSALELKSSMAANAESQSESKAEFSFGTPAVPFASAAQAVPKVQPTLNAKAHNAFKPISPFFGTPASPATPTMLTSFAPAGAASSSLASTSSKLGDTFSTPTGTTALKVGATQSNASPFLASSTSSFFGLGSGSVQSTSVIATSVNLFTSSDGPGATPPTNMFTSISGTGTSASLLPPGPAGFGQLSSFPFKSPSTTSGPLVSPDFQASGPKDSSSPLADPERPQKRSMSSFQQDLSKRQQPLATMSNHSFTSFGTSVGTSAATPEIPVTFAAGTSSTTTSQGLFSVSSFSQASTSAPQVSSALPSTASIPFTFGTPTSAAGSTSSASSAPAFGNTPSFPPFTTPVFGTVSSGSTFGVTPAAQMAFGTPSTAPAFGSASASSVFGAFAGESASQTPSTGAFGSGFSTPTLSTTPTFPFGATPPAFTFGTGASTSASGAAFSFGPPGAFSFAANKSAPQSPQPSVFGLSSSIPAFGNTTNGTMSSDLVVIEQSNMDDNSMAEEPSQIGGSVSPQPPIFGGQSSAGTGSFVFGAQTGAPGPTVSPGFGGFQPPTSPAGFAAAPANPFAAPQPTGSLDFSGAAFALGSGGDRPTTRKMFKAKRTGAKRGK